MKQILTIFFLFITLQVYPFEQNSSPIMVQMPSSEFKSVNNQNIYSGSKYVSEVAPAFQNTQTQNNEKPGMRKVGFNDDPNEPYPDPIQEIPMLLFVVLCLLYTIIKFKPRRKIFGV